eukprot:6481929-Amphidinium_carterae.4
MDYFHALEQLVLPAETWQRTPDGRLASNQACATVPKEQHVSRRILNQLLSFTQCDYVNTTHGCACAAFLRRRILPLSTTSRQVTAHTQLDVKRYSYRPMVTNHIALAGMHRGHPPDFHQTDPRHHAEPSPAVEPQLSRVTRTSASRTAMADRWLTATTLPPKASAAAHRRSRQTTACMPRQSVMAT